MINLARQAFANPFLSAGGTSFQPGVVNTVGRCPCCGSTVAVASPIQPQLGGLQTQGVGGTLGQQMGGFASAPFAGSQTGFPQIHPLASQLMGSPQTINPLAAQLGTNWPVSAISHQGIGTRPGGFGVDPRLAFGGVGQQFGFNDPNVVPGLNQPITGDPISSLFQQQVNPLGQQQLPIRSLFGGQQGLGGQSLIPGIGSQVGQWADPYRSFIEAQLISQLTNPLYQLQRAYGGPETGIGTPFGAGQQFNPFFANIPFNG
jgi:hypothetical protein